ncbi:hypothetical protein AJ80_04032 [Polytolypa hystricis UAMH7299]|uniref:Uncharacterized protein n=1 Tax=Polytolypa hystricis (strain UAMH7299) TaxID=1447883 RepID=A0A2B7YDW9_POLH7|nr:hypothetical protein AJ80_04032 [Polytolypa hystricis UAMH7299]
MSRALKDFKNLMVREGQISKLWKTHSPGTRIAPTKSGNKDNKWQLRLDAGEVKGGKKRIYLQVNSQASNQSLQKWLKKNTSHANLAFGDIDINEPDDKISGAFDNFWQCVEKQAKDNLG